MRTLISMLQGHRRSGEGFKNIIKTATYINHDRVKIDKNADSSAFARLYDLLVAGQHAKATKLLDGVSPMERPTAEQYLKDTGDILQSIRAKMLDEAEALLREAVLPLTLENALQERIDTKRGKTHTAVRNTLRRQSKPVKFSRKHIPGAVKETQTDDMTYMMQKCRAEAAEYLKNPEAVEPGLRELAELGIRCNWDMNEKLPTSSLMLALLAYLFDQYLKEPRKLCMIQDIADTFGCEAGSLKSCVNKRRAWLAETGWGIYNTGLAMRIQEIADRKA